MQQSGSHFQPHDQKAPETNFHPIISECQFKSVSSHTCLTTSKLNLSAHTNVSLSSKGRESHPHLVSHKCLTKLHAARRPPLSSLYDKKGQETNFHPNIWRDSHPHIMTNVSLGTNVSLSSRQPSSDHHCLQSLPNNTEEYLNSSNQATVTTTFNHDAASFLFFFSNVASNQGP